MLMSTRFDAHSLTREKKSISLPVVRTACHVICKTEMGVPGNNVDDPGPFCYSEPDQTFKQGLSYSHTVRHIDSVFQVLLEPNVHLRSICVQKFNGNVT